MQMLSWTQNEHHNPATYIIKTFCLTFASALLIGAIVSLLFPNAVQPDVGDVSLQPGFVFFGVVVASPILETLMMWPILALLSYVFRGQSANLIAIFSAAVWGIFHSLAAPIWGLVIFIPFVMFSLCFLNWKKRSIWMALGMTMACHALHNFVPFLMMLVAPVPAT